MLLAAFAMFTQLPGSIVPDTKFDLYIDPLFFMDRVRHGWDPGTYLGFIPHQAMSYLFPMGTFFYLTKLIGLPVWISQRLWQTGLLFVAGSGIVALMDTLRGKPRGVTHWIAALFFMFNPYVIMWLPRTSGMLLPYVFLPWLLNYFVKGMWRPRGWKYPLLTALMFFFMTGLNAASTVFILAAPFIYFCYHVYVLRTSKFRTAVKFAAKTALVAALLSVWWIVPLLLQGKLALNILSFTEPSYITNLTSSFSESVRLFGFWFFYGGDRFGAWFRGSLSYLSNPVLVVTTFVIPVLAIGAQWVVRWRYRIYFGMLMVASVLLMVGIFPPQAPSPYGHLLNWFYDRWEPAMAFRNTYKAAPMLALSFAVLLAVGTEALYKRWRENRELAGHKPGWTPWVPVALILALMAVNTYGFWTASAWDPSLAVKGDIPQYWRDAAKQIDAFGLTEEQKRRQAGQGVGPAQQSYRALMLPGQSFAYYQWGVTLDDINQSLIKRPTLLRTLVPYGSPYGANYTAALDGAIQQGVLAPNTLIPMAKYLGIGDVVLRHDLEWQRWDNPRPAAVTGMLSKQGLVPGPGGGKFGEPGMYFKDETKEELLQTDFGFPSVEAKLAPVEYMVIQDPLPIVRADKVDRPILLSGDNYALMQMASFGYLDSNTPFFLSGSQSQQQLEETLRDKAVIFVSDQNRRRAWQFGIIRNNYSYTLAAGQELNRGGVADRDWQVFDEVGAKGVETTSVLLGDVERITASSYGSFWYELPEYRPQNVMDKNLNTSWSVGGLGNPVGAQLEVTMKRKTEVNEVTVVLKHVPGSRNVGKLMLITDSGKEIPLDLKQTGDPQTFKLPEKASTQSLRFRIDGLNGTDQFLPPVGIAEIEIPGVSSQEMLRTPDDLFTRAPGGNEAAFASNNLVYTFQRERSQAGDFLRADEEANMQRLFRTPGSREYAPRAMMSLSPAAPDPDVDRILGITGPVASAASSSRWLGFPTYRGMSATDGDPDSFWAPAIYSKMVGETLDVKFDAPRTISEFNFDFIENEVHSGIAKAKVTFSDGTTREFEFEPISGTEHKLYNRKIDPPIAASSAKFEITEIRPVITKDAMPVPVSVDNPEARPILMPTAVAELGIEGAVNTTPSDLDEFVGPCPQPPTKVTREQIDSEGAGVIPSQSIWANGEQVAFRPQGKVEDFLQMLPIAAEPCSSEPIQIEKGTDNALFTSTQGAMLVDRVSLESVVVGGDSKRFIPPQVKVTDVSRTSWDLEVTGADQDPYYLILGENINPGWRAKITKSDGSTIDLGEPKLINGYANAWKVQPTGGKYSVKLDYKPQQLVYVGLFISLFTLVVVIFFLIQIRQAEISRRRVRAPRGPGGGRPAPPPGARGGPPANQRRGPAPA